MGVVIDQKKCVKCLRCVRICPGNVIRKTPDGIPCIPYPSDCWNCTSCMKECPAEAISLVLPPEMGGRGARMTLQQSGHLTNWKILRSDDSSILLVTDTDVANRY